MPDGRLEGIGLALTNAGVPMVDDTGMHTLGPRLRVNVLIDERDRLHAALATISRHAHMDEHERGFSEASRYYGIADEALASSRKERNA